MQLIVDQLNHRYKHHSATAVLQAVLKERILGNIALVSSFGAESVALIHLCAMVDRSVPILFIDTQYLFTETLVYQQEITERLGLRCLKIIQARSKDIALHDKYGALKFTDPNACCHVRKTAPLEDALSNYAGWITGRKRFQNAQRAQLEFFEFEPDPKIPGQGRIKINPLAHWSSDDVRTYMDENRLPRHPLVARGFPSIGCAPCTSAVKDGEDPRSGRWRNQEKSECGIHRGKSDTQPIGDPHEPAHK